MKNTLVYAHTSLRYVFLALLFSCFITGVHAQEKVSDFPIKDVENASALNAKIAALEQQKEAVLKAEKEALKKTILEIDKRLKNGRISSEQAKTLKEEAAALRAQNIESRTAIIALEMELLKRNKAVLQVLKRLLPRKTKGLEFR